CQPASRPMVRVTASGGLGLGLRTSFAWNAFDELSSERTFCHSRASGTVACADPQRELLCVMLTTRPCRQDNGVRSSKVTRGSRARTRKQRNLALKEGVRPPEAPFEGVLRARSARIADVIKGSRIDVRLNAPYHKQRARIGTVRPAPPWR